MTQILRVQDEVYKEIKRLSEEDDLPMGSMIAKALTEYKKARFFNELDAAFTQLKSDPAAWAEEQDERNQSERTLMDGLDND